MSYLIIVFVTHATLFTSVLGKVYFLEEFVDGDKWQERWVLSENPSRQNGFFILTAGRFYGHPEMSKGIQTFQNGMKYGMSVKFPPFSNEGNPLVVQFTVKQEQNVKCGGGYIKLFNCSLEPKELHEDTPYLLMFGPDKCIPTTFKVHLTFNYKGKYLELKKRILPEEDIFTHLYTLILNPDNTYMVKIDHKDVAKGKLEDDWDFLPPKEIPDYSAKKPNDWLIDDPDDEKPPGWDQPEFIPDPNQNDFENSIDSEQKTRLIKNPAFKGPWKPRRIKNPKYKEPWERPQKRNPDYNEDPELYKMDEICGVGFDIWQVEAGTIFDNILITDDIEFAEEHGWKTTGLLKDAEKLMARGQLNKNHLENMHGDM